MSALSQLRPDARLDLHMHSSGSDGRYSPDEVVKRAAAGGLELIALTDHDLPAQLPAGRALIGGQAIHVLHGVEVSGVHQDVELHLLVYFAGEMPPAFADFCRELAQRRADRYDRARDAIGLPDVPEADHAAHQGERALTRLHLAMALVEAGHCSSLREAFSRYTGDKHRRVPRCTLTFLDAIRIARSFGGVTSWAHPKLDHARLWTKTFAQSGLQGLEVIRPFLGKNTRRQLTLLAEKNGLLLTGGSDFHGWNEKHHLGRFAVRAEQARSLASALQAA